MWAFIEGFLFYSGIFWWGIVIGIVICLIFLEGLLVVIDLIKAMGFYGAIAAVILIFLGIFLLQPRRNDP